MLLFINVFLLIFNLVPQGILCHDVEAVTTEMETPAGIGEGQERNGRLIGLLGLLTGLNIVDSLDEDDEPEIRTPVVSKRTDWPSRLKVAYVHPNGKLEFVLNPDAYHDLLLHHYYPQYYTQNDRHGANIQTIKVSSSSINPIQQTTSPILETTLVNDDLPEIIINKRPDELRSGSNKETQRKVSNNEGKRTSKLVETTTTDDEWITQSTLEPVIRKKKEAKVTTMPSSVTDETTLDTTTTESDLATTIQSGSDQSDSLFEGSTLLSQVLIPPSHTIATFKPTVPMKGAGYGGSSLNNIDLIYLTTLTPPSQKFKRTYKFRPSARDYFLDKQDGFVPLYFRDVNSNHFELPVSGDSALYEFEPLLN